MLPLAGFPSFPDLSVWFHSFLAFSFPLPPEPGVLTPCPVGTPRKDTEMARKGSILGCAVSGLREDLQTTR